MATQTHPKKDRQKLLNLLSLISVEMGVIMDCILTLAETAPELAEFEENLYVAKDRVIEVWEDWKNVLSDDHEQLAARRARARCKIIANDPDLSGEDKITKLVIAYSLSFMKRDRLYRIIERPIRITRYEPEGSDPICRYYWQDGALDINGTNHGKKRICRAPLATLDILREAIEAGDSEAMLGKIRQTGQREVMAWVPIFQRFVTAWLDKN
jgi:hypothetical protein